MYEHLDPYHGDPILSLMTQFMADTRPERINLSIGLYYDGDGRIPVLESVRRAEALLRDADTPKVYLPMEGSARYRQEVQKLVFGAGHPALAEGRVATIQTLGASGALRVASELMHRFFPESQVWVSDPTWDNHQALLARGGLKVNTYPYYDQAAQRLRFDEMLATFRSLPRNSLVLLQPSCHNPSGVDLSAEQWTQVTEALVHAGAIPFFDMAYQGFGAGIEEDAAPIRAMVAAGLPVICSTSFSKNFSLYGERCGSLHFVSKTADEAKLLMGQLQLTVRGSYSSPALHGAQVIEQVLGTPELRTLWEGELAAMRERMAAVRQQFVDVARGIVGTSPLDAMASGHGMFSFTGLSREEVRQLRDDHAVYLVESSRICVTGLNDRTIRPAAEAIATVMRARKA